MFVFCVKKKVKLVCLQTNDLPTASTRFRNKEQAGWQPSPGFFNFQAELQDAVADLIVFEGFKASKMGGGTRPGEPCGILKKCRFLDVCFFWNYTSVDFKQFKQTQIETCDLVKFMNITMKQKLLFLTTQKHKLRISEPALVYPVVFQVSFFPSKIIGKAKRPRPLCMQFKGDKGTQRE